MAKNATYELAIKISGNADSTLRKAVNEANSSIASLGAGAKKALKVTAGVAAAVGGAVAAAGKALYNLGSEFDSAYDAIRIGTGATGDALEGLKDDMKRVYSSVPTTMEDAGKAIADYNTRLGLSGSALQEVSKQAIQVSGMLGDDLGSVIEQSSKAFQQWNIDADSMGGAMDYMFKVSQSTGMGFSDLMGEMQKFGPQLQDMGYSFETASSLVGQLDKAGVNTDEVLGAMKKSVGALAKKGISASVGMEKYTQKIKNAGTEAEAASIASEIFGARAGSTMAAAIRNGSLAVDELTSSLLSSGETIAVAAADTYDLSEKWTMFKNRMAVALEPVATTVFDSVNAAVESLMPKVEELIPYIVDGIQRIIPKITAAVKWVWENKKAIATLIGVVGGLVAAYKIAKGVMAVYNTISAIHKAITLASIPVEAADTAAKVADTGATASLAVATNALCWPILLVMAAIVALIAVVILLVKNWDKVKAVAAKVWETIKSIWNAVAGWFMDNVITPLVNFFSPIIETISGIFKGCWIIIKAVWVAVSTWFNEHVIAPLVNFFAPIVEKVSGFFSTMWSNIVTVWSAVGAWFSEHVAGPISAAFQTVSDFVKGIFNGLLGFVERMINGVIGAINRFIGGFSKIVSKAASFLGIDWGGISEIPTVTLPRLATGGIATGPTLAEVGEGAEPEAILPLSKLSAMLDGMGGGGGGWTYAPQIVVNGNASKDDIKEVLDDDFERFKSFMSRFQRENKRKQFA